MRGSQNKEIRSNWSSTWKTISPLLEKMLNASLHKSIVHRHLRRGCNIQSGQSCFDLGYSNYNLTRITWAWVLGITWDASFVVVAIAMVCAITMPTDARGSLQLVVAIIIHKKDSFPSWATKRKERHDRAQVPRRVSVTALETHEPCSGPPVAKSLVCGSGGFTHLGITQPGPGFFLSFESLKLGRWDLGLELVRTQDFGK